MARGRDRRDRAGSHPLAPERGEASLEAISAHPLVLREGGSGVRQIVERAFARAGAPMRVALEIAGVEGVKEAVRAGMGIGFVSGDVDAARRRRAVASEHRARNR